jgi:hypothetical protein
LEVAVADIFISYSREDAVRAAALADAFTSVGWSVWFDDAIRAGAPYDAVIDQQLDAAACVVVVWSRASIDSSWVRAEASAADEQAKLVPVTFERGLRVPVRFRQIHVSHLTSTDILEPTPEARALLADVAQLTGRQARGVDPPTGDGRGGPRSSGAQLVTVGNWRLTTRFLRVEGRYDLELRPNGTLTGTAKWAISRANLAGRWFYDPADQVLHLDMSGGIQDGTKAMAVQITRWVGPDPAECVFEGRKARLERVMP